MRILMLTALTMTAFAANSVLNRLAVGPGHIGPVEFAVVRLLAGAAMLARCTGGLIALPWYVRYSRKSFSNAASPATNPERMPGTLLRLDRLVSTIRLRKSSRPSSRAACSAPSGGSSRK